ncbi:aminotransferase class V-fold PLP-dependent enzyme [Chitinophaga silvatica]|uniref:Aminotransferase class V-fold PLP-dependent enzyme n=1 Tax=Chitinophaga silvatica TaxID=2282649 RepID=A0A3E1YDQ9_9BACT|nr:aminotransferase class V-fold PLP-dependent enzyme [Chitinophaga silvatica]RFS24740.1 aminotransferase class V-fold PLP-dependent enzyme [Chitinophaga silvatica]
MDIKALRNETPGCKHVNHLNNAGAALMPQPVIDAVQNYFLEEANYGGYETAAKHEREVEQFYEASARLLGCKPTNIAFTTNATDSYDKALSALEFKEGDVVLLSKNDYPSNFISLLSIQKRIGIKLVEINNTDTGEIDLEDLEAKIKQYHPRLLSITHIPTSSGLVQPVNEIGNIVKNYDLLYLLDACQSIGQMEVDALSTQADFISGTFRKFLRGPRGSGILYASDKALTQGLSPLYLDMRGADWINEQHYKTRDDARRFELWEFSYANILGSKVAIEYALKLGMQNIWERNQHLTALLKTELAAAGMTLQDRGKVQSSIVTFTMPVKTTGEKVKKYLNDKGINVNFTSKSVAIIDFEEKGIDWAVRVSPHYYNTEEEIFSLVEALKEFI